MIVEFEHEGAKIRLTRGDVHQKWRYSWKHKGWGVSSMSYQQFMTQYAAQIEAIDSVNKHLEWRKEKGIGEVTE